jgi:hypothetical protein
VFWLFARRYKARGRYGRLEGFRGNLAEVVHYGQAVANIITFAAIRPLHIKEISGAKLRRKLSRCE